MKEELEKDHHTRRGFNQVTTKKKKSKKVAAAS